MKRTSPSNAGPILAAVVMTVAFFGVAIVAALALLAVPIVELASADGLHWQTASLCVLGGIAILTAIWPRGDRFLPPGVRLDERDHPRLFELIRDVAKPANQSVPAEVYLVPDADVYVAERGGILGFGCRRVMGIGLPLLQALSVSPLRGVVAREFGKNYGDDTKLGRWVRRTRQAIVRSLQGRRQSVIRLPFVGYAMLFLRITKGMARQQEFAADAFAVDMVGRRNYADGLRRAYGIAPAFDAYWQSEMVPVLSSGYRTPIAAGFERFLANPEVERKVAAAGADRQQQTMGVYDMRPSLSDRLSAIDELPEGPATPETKSAIGLLDRLSDQELAMLRFQFGPERANKLRSIEWRDAGRQVFVPLWRKTANEFGTIFREFSIDRLPELARSPDPLRQAIVAQASKPLSVAEQAAAVESLLGSALAQSLAALKWETTAQPGSDVEVRQEETVVTPFLEVRRWIDDAKAAEGWLSFCKELGIVEAPILWPEKATVEVSLDELSSKFPVGKTKKPAEQAKPTA